MMRKLLIAVAIFLWGTLAKAEEIILAALGDSLTHGYGLPPEQGFVPQLEAWLAENGAEVTVINAGVSGDTTAGGLARLGWTLTTDVDGLIVALGANDALRGIDPDVARANLSQILQQTAARDLPVLLIGTAAPGNFGPAYKHGFEAIYPDLAETFNTLLAPDFLAALTGLGPTATAYAPYLQGDGLHPNADGVALIVEDLGPYVLDLVAASR